MSYTIPSYMIIRTSEDLRSCLRFLDRATTSGRLKQYFPGKYISDTEETVQELTRDLSTFPDTIDMYFTDTETGKRYQVSVDAYHGGPGELSEIQKDDWPENKPLTVRLLRPFGGVRLFFQRYWRCR